MSLDVGVASTPKEFEVKLLKSIGLIAAGLLSLSLQAAPIVFVDTDPGTAGIQSSIIIAPNTTFSVDIVVQGVEASQPLQAFEFDLGFDSALMTALSVVEGGFLLGPFGTTISEQNVTPPDVNFTVGAIGVSTSFGDGVLATIQFLADGVGVGTLGLSNVILAAFPSTPIPLDGVNSGSVVIQQPGAAAPAANTLALFALGLPLLGGLRRTRQG